MTKRPFTTKGLKAEQPLKLVHSDICGPFSTQARGGYIVNAAKGGALL